MQDYPTTRPATALFSRPFVLSLGIIVLLLSGLAVMPTLRPADPEISVKTGPVKLGEPAWARLDLAPTLRTASAGTLAGELDTVADKVYGQSDFTTGTTPITATHSSLNQPSDIYVFDSGQVFVADTGNNRVLGWNCLDSYTSGDRADFVLGQPDFDTTTALDPPTASSMNAPTGLTVGFDGFLYVSDTGNNRVLVFFPTNYDQYWEDAEVYYDPDDYYCAEGLWHPSDFYAPIYVDGQEADYALGQPSFTSGDERPTSASSLKSPMGLVTDANDNLVVADHGNNRLLIYEWNEAGAIGPRANWVGGQEIQDDPQQTFFLNAAPDPPTQRSLNGPTGVAAGILGNEIYVADTGNNRILIFNDAPVDNVADGLIGQPDYTSNTPNNGGLSASSLSRPTGLSMDGGTRLHVADTDNQRVLVYDQINPDGVADGVYGQPDFVSNTANNGGISAASLNTPLGIATDELHMDVFIADSGNNRALQYNQPLSNPVPAIAELDPGTVRAGTGDFRLGIWGSGIISDTVVEINGVTRTVGSEFLGYTEAPIAAGEVMTTGQITVTLRNPAPGGGVSAPFVLTIYTPTVGDDLADNVLGQKGFTTDDGPFAPMQPDTLFEPAGAVVDPTSGRLFVADTGNARILSWPNSQARADGGQADLVFGKPDFTTYFYSAESALNLIRPVGVALDSQGNLYATDAQSNLVLIYTKPFTNGMAANLLIHGLSNPLALGLDSQDNLYVADSYHHRVLFYEKPLASGDTTPDRVIGQPDMASTAPNAGGAISATSLHHPSGLALDSADNLYVADSSNNRVLVYLDPDNGDATADLVFGQIGDFTTGEANKGGVSARSLNYPFGLVVDSQGSLYVADVDNNRVLRYENALSSDDVADYVIGQGGSLTRGSQQIETTPSQSSLRSPFALGLGPNGDLFVVDNGNNRVLGFQGVVTTTVKSRVFLPSVIQ